MAENEMTRDPLITARDVFALSGIALVAGGAYVTWGLGVALMAGGILLLLTAMVARG